MTYRLVPPRVWAALQKIVLIVTAIVGGSIAVAPADLDSKITVIEQAMNVDVWAALLIVFSLIALACELDMERRKHERWLDIVAYCHIILCSLLVGYSFAALVGVLARVWWNFGAPALGGLLSYLHFIYVRRRPRAKQ